MLRIKKRGTHKFIPVLEKNKDKTVLVSDGQIAERSG